VGLTLHLCKRCIYADLVNIAGGIAPVIWSFSYRDASAFGRLRMRKTFAMTMAVTGFILLPITSFAETNIYVRYCRLLNQSLRGACLAQYRYDITHHVPIGP
jgi:hypothetical protein